MVPVLLNGLTTSKIDSFKLTLPEFIEPDSLENAGIFINRLGKNIHEHAYIVGKTLSWVKVKVGHGHFQKWVEDNLWFSYPTANHFMNYATACDKAKTLLEYHGLGFKTLESRDLAWLRYTNHWYFNERDKTLGIEYPGNIPGQIALNVVYYYTNEGDLIIDPMAGGGSTIDACKFLNRRCLAYDINPVRDDIKKHDVTKELPPEAMNCKLIFLDPPYHTLLKDEYTFESVSSLSLDDFKRFLHRLAQNCYSNVQNRGFVSFLCQNFYHKFASLNDGYTDFALEAYNTFTTHGLRLVNRVNCPQSSQVYSASDIELAKKQKGMLNVVRDLLIFQKGRG